MVEGMDKEQLKPLLKELLKEYMEIHIDSNDDEGLRVSLFFDGELIYYDARYIEW
jgi:hypothetical protein